MAGRRWWLLLLACALAASGLVTASASAGPPDQDPRAQAARATKLTLRASLDEAAYGTTVTLSGKLTSGGKGLKGQKVVIKHRVSGAKTWTRVGTVTTRRKGVWRKDVQVRVRGSYLATYRGTRTYAPSRAAKQQIDSFAFLTDYAVGPGGRDAYRDEPWTFTGRTAPELAGQPVHVVRGPFRISTAVATGTVGPGGAISLTHRMTDVGRYDYWLSVDGGLLMYGADSPHSSITTRAVGAPTTPSITTTSLPSVEVHVPYQATFLAAGGEVTWSAVGALPPGLTLSSDGVLTGTPSQAGTWEVGVRASNVAGTTTRTVSLTVAQGSLTVTTGRLYDAAVGVPYPHTPYTSGGWQEMFCTPCQGGATWAVTSGSLPPGMDFVDGDDIVDPPASYVYGTATQPGVYQFTISGVVDGRSGSKQFTLRVVPSTSDLIRIDYNDVTFRLPAGTVGQPYSHQLTARGGTGLAWSALGPPPPGLTLSSTGLLSGTPTRAGDGWLDVAATDGARYDWQGFLIAVAPPP